MSSILYLYVAGKRQARSPVEARVTGGSSSRLLYVMDKHSKTRFLIDTGAEVSVFPATQHDKLYRRKGVSLTAANNSAIHTYAKRELCLDLGLHRKLKWSFLIAR
jgi:cleavage and polyadenylation specificity factor subunit 1